MPYRRGQPRKHMTWQENIGLTRYRCCQVAQYGGTHSAALLPFPASSLPRELVSGRHLPLPEAVGWPRPPYRTTCQTTWRLRHSTLENGVRKRHYLPRFRKFEQTCKIRPNFTPFSTRLRKCQQIVLFFLICNIF